MDDQSPSSDTAVDNAVSLVALFRLFATIAKAYRCKYRPRLKRKVKHAQ